MRLKFNILFLDILGIMPNERSEVRPASEASFILFMAEWFKKSYFCYAVTFNLNAYKFFQDLGGDELVSSVLLFKIDKFSQEFNIDRMIMVEQTSAMGKIHVHGVLSIKRKLDFRKCNKLFYDMQIYLERTKVFPVKSSCYNIPKVPIPDVSYWIKYTCRDFSHMWGYRPHRDCGENAANAAVQSRLSAV